MKRRSAIRPRRLLVVDDDRDFAESLAEVLQMAGHDVDVALSGEQALSHCRDGRFDLALVDVRMSGMSGVESLRAMRALQPSLRAIMMTGYAVEPQLEEALACGAWRVLSKPLDLDSLLAMVEVGCTALRVLVADDDRDVADSLAQALELAGHRTAVARDGAEALSEVLRRRPDVLVLDLRMPLRSGVEVVRDLARQGVAPAIVVVTGFAREERAALAELEAQGLLAVLEKPVHPDALLNVMTRVEHG